MQFEPDLRDYLQVVMRRRWIIMTCFVVVVAAVLIWSIKQIPMYESTATLLIEQRQPKVISVEEVKTMGAGEYASDKNYYETQYKLIKGRILLKKVADLLDLTYDNSIKESNPVAQSIKKVTDLLGLPYDNPNKESNPVEQLLKVIVVKPVKNSQLVEISAQHPSPEMAARIANTLSDEFIKQNLQRNVNAANSAGKWLSIKIEEQRLKLKEAERALSTYRRQHNISLLQQTAGEGANEDLRAEYARLQASNANYSERYTDEHPRMIELRAQIESLRNKIQGLDDINKSNITMEYRNIESEVQTNKDLYNALLSRLQEIDLSSKLNVNNISIIDRAEVAVDQVSPDIKKNVIMATLISIIIGLGLGFFVDYADASIKSSQDVIVILESHLLGSIPEIKGKDKTAKNKLVHVQPRSPISETYRDVRTEILSLTRDLGVPAVFMITSAEPQAGKTMTVINMGIALAQQGSRVLIVDSDMRRPQIHNIFNLGKQSGLSEYLSESVSLESIIKDTEIENLKVITAGKPPDNPAELLSLKRIEELISKLKEGHDLVIFDTPPVASVTDAIILADMVDAVIQVVRSGKAPIPVVQRAKDKLIHTRAQFLGIILNDLKAFHGDSYYNYKYYRYYGEDMKSKSEAI